MLEALREMTGGRGPGCLHRRSGMEGHAHGIIGAYDRVKQALTHADRSPTVLRQAIVACRNGGTVSVPGVYGGFIDKVPFGSIVNQCADDQDPARPTCSVI